MYRAGIVTLSIILKLMVGRVFALVAYYCCWNYWRCASKIEQIFHNWTQFVFVWLFLLYQSLNNYFKTSKTYWSYPGIAIWWALLTDIWSCYNLFLTMSQIWIIEILACDLFCLHLVVVERKEVWRGWQRDKAPIYFLWLWYCSQVVSFYGDYQMTIYLYFWPAGIDIHQL